MSLFYKILLSLFTISHFLTYTDLYSVMIIVKLFCLFILASLWIYSSRRHGIPIGLVILFYTILMITTFSSTLFYSLLHWGMILGYCLMLLLLKNKIDILRVFQKISLLLLVLSVIITIVDPSTINFRGDNISLYGIFNNNNTLGQLAFFNFLVSFIIVFQKPNFKLRYFLVLILPILIALLSSSRSIILSISFVIILFFIKKKFKYKPLILVSLILGSVLLFQSIVYYLLDIFRIDSLNPMELSTSRLNLYKYFMNNISEVPFFGYGLGNQTMIWNESFVSNSTFGLEGFGFHNTFIQIFLELGILGFLILIALIIRTAFRLYRYYNISFLIAFISIIISSFFETNILYISSPMSILFWYLIILSFSYKGGNNEYSILAKHSK